MKFVVTRLQLSHRVFMYSLKILVGTFCGIQVSSYSRKLVSGSLFQVERLLFEVADIVISILHLSLLLGQVTTQRHIDRVLGIKFILVRISSLTFSLELELCSL